MHPANKVCQATVSITTSCAFDFPPCISSFRSFFWSFIFNSPFSFGTANTSSHNATRPVLQCQRGVSCLRDHLWILPVTRRQHLFLRLFRPLHDHPDRPWDNVQVMVFHGCYGIWVPRRSSWFVPIAHLSWIIHSSVYQATLAGSCSTITPGTATALTSRSAVSSSPPRSSPVPFISLSST